MIIRENLYATINFKKSEIRCFDIEVDEDNILRINVCDLFINDFSFLKKKKEKKMKNNVYKTETFYLINQRHFFELMSMHLKFNNKKISKNRKQRIEFLLDKYYRFNTIKNSLKHYYNLTSK